MLAGWQRAAQTTTGVHVACGAVILALAGGMWLMWRRLLASRVERDCERRGRAVVVPLRTTGGRMMGAVVVRADSVMQVRRRVAEEAVAALEVLGTKLGRAMENAELAERLLRAEKLAGLGMLAGGVAHALNN